MSAIARTLRRGSIVLRFRCWRVRRVRRIGGLAFAAALFLVAPSAFADLIINFEGFPDSTPLANQYPGLSFTNATILTAGISLNELEFPPHSGVDVAFDDGGPMMIQFTTPWQTVGGYFTHIEQLTLGAYDSSNSLVGSTTSVFMNNLALSGDPGSYPNEYLSLTVPGGIWGLVITGDPAGGSFTIDDFSATDSSAAQEPTSLLLLFTAIGGLLAIRRKFAI